MIPLLGAPSAPKSPYLARDTFRGSDLAAPLTSPRTGQRGPRARVSTSNLWTVTDVESVIKILGGRLRGGVQASANWGDAKVVGPAMSRVTGRGVFALIGLDDAASDLACGWDTATNTTDPRTVGHGWVSEGGTLCAITPGLKVILDNANGRAIRPMGYLVATVLNDLGAYTLISTFAADSGDGMVDQVGIPQWPTMRVLWVDRSGSTATLYPYVSFYDAGDGASGYPNGHFVEDLRVADLPAPWNVADGIAGFTDRFTRADSNTTLGGAWVANTGVWGISGNQAYNVSGSGFRTAHNPSSGAPADGLYRWVVTLPASWTAASDPFRLTCKHAAAGDFLCLNSNGSATAISLQKWASGAFSSTITNFTLASTLTGGSTHEFVLRVFGNTYELLQNGVTCNGTNWVTDAGSNYVSATGIGFGVANGRPTEFRFDDLAIFPHTVTAPPIVARGAKPSAWAVGGTLASDTFTDTNGTALASHTPDLGSGWTTAVFGGSNGIGWTIQSNALTHNRSGAAVGGAAGLAHRDVGAADVEIAMDISTSGSLDLTNGRIRCGLVLRYVDTSNFVAVRHFMDPSQAGNDEVEVVEYISGTGAIVHRVVLGNLYAQGTTYALRVQVKGDRLRVFLADKPRVEYVLRGSLTATRHGVYKADEDSFDGSSTTASCTIDNWTAKAVA